MVDQLARTALLASQGSGTDSRRPGLRVTGPRNEHPLSRALLSAYAAHPRRLRLNVLRRVFWGAPGAGVAPRSVDRS